MQCRLPLPSLLTLAAFGLAACGEQTTEPNTAEDQPTVPQLAVTSNTWLTRREMPLELVNQAAAVVPNAQGQSILYVIGGYKAESGNEFVAMGEVRAYNVATNTWSTKRDMPAPRYAMNGAGVIRGKIYVTGGSSGRHQKSASVFAYDPASNTWTRKRDMPAPGVAGMTGVIGGQLYVVTTAPDWPRGGINFFRYNPTRDSWTRLPSPPDSAMVPNRGGVIGKKFYVISSNTSDGANGAGVLEYDPATNQWTRKRSWRNPCAFCNTLGPSTVMLGRVYVFSSSILIYDPASDTWETKPRLTRFSYWADYELTAAARRGDRGSPSREQSAVHPIACTQVRNNEQRLASRRDVVRVKVMTDPRRAPFTALRLPQPSPAAYIPREGL
jgi:hypothetical protein